MLTKTCGASEDDGAAPVLFIWPSPHQEATRAQRSDEEGHKEAFGPPDLRRQF